MRSYSYQDIHLYPNYSTTPSRSNLDVSVEFGGRRFRVPVLPANMKCTIDEGKSRWFSENDYFYIMHRFGKGSSTTPEEYAEDNFQFVRMANHENWKTVSISIGVQELDKQFLQRCIVEGLRIDLITIDIAHAHSIRMRQMLEFISNLNFNTPRPFIIAGNVATPEAVIDLEQWGADSVKVGIAQGGACTTYGQTGFGVPMFSCMLDCSRVAKKPLIADGGIKLNGDFAKALVAGGTVVMAGSIFAASIDSPADTVVKYFKTNEVEPSNVISDGLVTSGYKEKVVRKVYKQYFGSASSHNKHSDAHVEGTLIELECDGTTYAQKLKYIAGHLQSSLSYGGGSFSKVRWGVR